MFHILTENAVPEWLYSGHTTNTANGRHQAVHEDANNVLCGAGVGERREAISYKKYISYFNNGKLRVANLCSACAKKVGIKKETNVTSEKTS